MKKNCKKTKLLLFKKYQKIELNFSTFNCQIAKIQLNTRLISPLQNQFSVRKKLKFFTIVLDLLLTFYRIRESCQVDIFFLCWPKFC